VSTLIWAKMLKCDLCGTQAETTLPAGRPEGWEMLTVNLGRSPFHEVDICPACIKLPLSRLIEHLRKLGQ